jgi:hypothetical protein
VPSTNAAKTETATAGVKPDPTKVDATKTASQKTESPVASVTPTSATDPKSSNAGGPDFELKIKVNKQSWVSIKADGKTLVNSTLAAGTERSFKASDKIEVILGNSSGVEVSYNGKPVENLSMGQDVRKLTFTASGYQ